jgi:hypothetical protein
LGGKVRPNAKREGESIGIGHLTLWHSFGRKGSPREALGAPAANNTLMQAGS